MPMGCRMDRSRSPILLPFIVIGAIVLGFLGARTVLSSLQAMTLLLEGCDFAAEISFLFAVLHCTIRLPSIVQDSLFWHGAQVAAIVIGSGLAFCAIFSALRRR